MDDDFEIERLRASIQQEKQMRDMANESIDELVLTVDEYEKRVNGVEGESSEWKSRYEIQHESNEIMNKQILILQDKIQQAKTQVRDAQRAAQGGSGYQHPLGEISVSLIKTLEREKESISSQRRDMDWRIEQENKAYHRANEQRKVAHREMVMLSENMQELKSIPESQGGAPGSSPPRTPKLSMSQRSSPDAADPVDLIDKKLTFILIPEKK